MIEFFEVLFSFGLWLEGLGTPREHVSSIVNGIIALLGIPSFLWAYIKRGHALRKDSKRDLEFIARQQSVLLSFTDSERVTDDQSNIIFKIVLDADRRKIEKFFFKSCGAFEPGQPFREFFYESWNETLDNLTNFKLNSQKMSDYWKTTRIEFNALRDELLEECMREVPNNLERAEKIYFKLKNRFNAIENHYNMWLKDGYGFEERKGTDEK